MTRQTALSSLSFSKQRRLLTASQYKAVFDDATWKVSNREWLILARTNGQPTARLGLVLAKKNVRLAVQRNRLKRLVRETFRLQQLKGLDVVVLCRKGADAKTNPEIITDLNMLWQKLLKRHRQVSSTDKQ